MNAVLHFSPESSILSNWKIYPENCGTIAKANLAMSFIKVRDIRPKYVQRKFNLEPRKFYLSYENKTTKFN